CAAHLIRKAKALVLGELLGGFVNRIGELNRFLPDIELFKIEGEHSSVLPPSTFNVQLSSSAHRPIHCRRDDKSESKLIFSERIFFPTRAVLENGAKMMAIARFR